MPKEKKEFDADYDAEPVEDVEVSGSFIDSDREFPVETRCCVTGDDVKHSFCRYPDNERGTMMVMSRETMLRFSRKGRSLTEEFECVLQLRRGQEEADTKSS